MNIKTYNIGEDLEPPFWLTKFWMFKFAETIHTRETIFHKIYMHMLNQLQ